MLDVGCWLSGGADEVMVQALYLSMSGGGYGTGVTPLPDFPAAAFSSDMSTQLGSTVVTLSDGYAAR